MAKKDKAVEEEIPIEEAPRLVQALAAAGETPEQKQKRLAREKYRQRVIQAAKDHEDVLRRNGVLKPDEPFEMDIEAAVDRGCC